MAREKWPMAICRPIAAQFIGTDKIALFSFEATPSGDAKILEERHYVLVDADGVSPAELEGYRKLSLQG